MKQIRQNLNNGETQIREAPCPQNSEGHLLIRTAISLVSAGTERMLVEFGKANLIDKYRQHPDKVRMVVDKIKTDGLKDTLEAMQSKLDLALGLLRGRPGASVDVRVSLGGVPILHQTACLLQV